MPGTRRGGPENLDPPFTLAVAATTGVFVGSTSDSGAPSVRRAARRLEGGDGAIIAVFSSCDSAHLVAGR